MRDLMSSWLREFKKKKLVKHLVRAEHIKWSSKSSVFHTHHFDELKELDDGWVQKVVSCSIVKQGIDDWLKQVPFDDVAVVVFVLQPNDPPHESQRTYKYQNGVNSHSAKAHEISQKKKQKIQQIIKLKVDWYLAALHGLATWNSGIMVSAINNGRSLLTHS